MSLRKLLLTIAITALASPGAAVDGVIEINQARALTGGVTPGDTAGFPVTIDTSGSYVLTGNLVITDLGVNAIEVDADDVTLDLNGFRIGGPLTCSGSPPTCSGARTGAGIYTDVSLRQSVTVKNGFIEGMGSHGIDLQGVRIRVEGVDVRENGGVGIRVGSVSTVADCVAWLNESDGIQVGSASRVSDSVISVNGRWGIFATFSGSAGYGANVLTSNASGPANGLIEFGSNVCDGSPTCP